MLSASASRWLQCLSALRCVPSVDRPDARSFLFPVNGKGKDRKRRKEECRIPTDRATRGGHHRPGGTTRTTRGGATTTWGNMTGSTDSMLFFPKTLLAFPSLKMHCCLWRRSLHLHLQLAADFSSKEMPGVRARNHLLHIPEAFWDAGVLLWAG